MEKLVRGIHEFQTSLFSSQRDLFQRLAQGQNPDALFITCSDSRVNPNLITQTEPGDLFILRNAGNLVPPYTAAPNGEAATIEFAVVGLSVKDIIICGHSHCGAMKGLLTIDKLVDLPAMAAWLTYAEATWKILIDKYADRQGEALLKAAIEENVLVQLENLRTHPSVARGLAEDKLKLHGWVYKIETGEVFAFEPDQGQFVAVVEAPHGPIPASTRMTPGRAI